MYSMPPQIRGTLVPQRLSRLRSGKRDRLEDPRLKSSVFYCPGCATWRRTFSTAKTKLARSSILQGRFGPADLRPWTKASPYLSRASYTKTGGQHFSTSSAINVIGSRSVPSRFRELHDALDNVLETAADHVSVSRLQLAIRGLQSEDPVIRIAVLDLNDASATRRLVRLLLSDPLKSKEPWEDALESLQADGSQPILIKYGEESNISQDNLLSTLFIPSSILKKGKLELLVSSLRVGDELPHVPITPDTILTPTITIRTSHSGRNNFIRYPVHKAILCGTGLDGLLNYNSLLSRMNLGRESSSVRGAVDLFTANLQAERNREGITFIDTKQAEEALMKFRESVKNATEYERGWTTGNVQPLIDWLSSIAKTDDQAPLEPALQTLIEAILDAADKEESVKETQRLRSIKEASVPGGVRYDLDRTVSIWAERAHTELRNSLEEGFASTRWRGLAWWKLFWRGDDVSMITAEILQTRYLPQAEREMIWTAGKVKQAGLVTEARDLDDLPQPNSSGKNEGGSGDSGESVSVVEQPWPMKIALSRFQLGNSTIPSLQALSQSLVMFSISTTALTSALSTLLYVSESFSLYGSGTVAAVGLIYSLRRQQQKWETARSYWEKEVRETGRQALQETEILLRGWVQGSQRSEEVVAKSEARLAIERARRALDDVKGG